MVLVLLKEVCSPFVRHNPTRNHDSVTRPPKYIHFSMQKTNRDTQDALSHLSRMLHTEVKDLSVSGTKDKRGVTVQRVSLWRKNKTLDDVWRMVNGLNGRHTRTVALEQRGERGVRIADLSYEEKSLELGMLKGNAFLITLRHAFFLFLLLQCADQTEGTWR